MNQYNNPSKKVAVALIAVFVVSATLFFTVFNQLDGDSPKTAHKTVVGEAIPTLIVPHHDLVKSTRIELVEQHAAENEPDTIILISPNHFDTGRGELITTEKEWVIRGGSRTIQPALDLISRIVEEGLATSEASAFRGEHGIANLLQELNDNHPQATIVPLMVRESTSVETIIDTADLLAEECKKCMVVASIDMSHYQQAHVAEIHDRKTLRAFQELDIAELETVEIDSTRSAIFAAHWSQVHGMQHYELHAHTNSGYMVSDTSVETTTHIMGQYTEGEPAVPVEEVTFTVAGDTMFARGVNEALEQNGYAWLFERFGDRVLWGTDMSWVNLEGSIAENPTQASGESDAVVPLVFEPRALDLLQYLRITHAGLANNHALDTGAQGIDVTRHALEQIAIVPHGEPQSLDTAVQRIEQGDVTVSFIAAYVPSRVPALTELIRSERATGAQVVMLPHWGVEYESYPSAFQEELAQEWVDAGVRVIIGSHPHVVQPAEILTASDTGEKAFVLYSLGNFVFDQLDSPKTTTGLIATGAISQDSLRLILSPLRTIQIQPVLQQYEDKEAILETVCEPLGGCAEGVIELEW